MQRGRQEGGIGEGEGSRRQQHKGVLSSYYLLTPQQGIFVPSRAVALYSWGAFIRCLSLAKLYLSNAGSVCLVAGNLPPSDAAPWDEFTMRGNLQPP